MSKWEKGVMTEKGNALLTKLHSGTTLSITRAVVGAGAVTSDELRYLTNIPDVRQTLAFSTKSYPEDGKVAVPLKLTNISVTEEYKMTCVGIFAMDPDEGEILYMAAKTAVNEEITVPTHADNPSYFYVWTFYVKYGQADNVEITVDPSTAVTVEEMQAVLADHSEDTDNPHGVTAEQLGLGNVENTRDSEKNVAFASEAGLARKINNTLVIRLNGGRTEGTDLFTYDGSAGKSINVSLAKLGAAPAVESEDYPGCYYRTVDGETEWINPPMVHKTEYRTTERIGGKPVYAKCYDLNKNPLSASGKAQIEIPYTALVTGIYGAIQINERIDCLGSESLPITRTFAQNVAIISVTNNYNYLIFGSIIVKYTIGNTPIA